MTTIRPEISKDNPYWISKHRYYELKHFCLQYDEWKQYYLYLKEASIRANNTTKERIDTTPLDSQTEHIAMRMARLSNNIELIERLCKEAAPELSGYIFLAVTKDVPFARLQTKMQIPCGKDMFYDRYRKFFWLLDKER